MLSVKNICYRGGIARFDIPSSWKEEYELSGGAMFYEDKPDSGTFRLSVMSFSSKGKETGNAMVAGLIAKSGYVAIHEGLALKQHVEAAEEQGEQLAIYYWEIAVPVEPCNVRLAVFSYTVLKSQINDSSVLREIEVLDRSVLAAKFSREPGMSGDYERTNCP